MEPETKRVRYPLVERTLVYNYAVFLLLLLPQIWGVTYEFPWHLLASWTLRFVLPVTVIFGSLGLVCWWKPKIILYLLLTYNILLGAFFAVLFVMSCFLIPVNNDVENFLYSVLYLTVYVIPLIWLRKAWKTYTPEGKGCRSAAWLGGVLGVVLTLFILVLPTLPHDAAAPLMQDSNRAKQLALALLNYAEANGHFPPAYTVDADGKPLHSWRVLILPYLEQKELYDRIRLDEPWDSEWNSQFHDQSNYTYGFAYFRLMRKPDPPDQTVFQVVVGPDTLFPPDGKFRTKSEVLENELKICVVAGDPVSWMDPLGNIPQEKALAPLNTPGGIRLYYRFPLFARADMRASWDLRSFSGKQWEWYIRENLKVNEPGAPQ